MPSEICQNLWNKEKKKELKKHSIYLLGDDEKDRGFEFFVFIDPEGKRPDFLRILHHIIKGEEIKDFLKSDQSKELKKWIGAESDDDEMLTPLNWLKIAIEQYPYRLFVVIDENNWSKDGKSPLNGMPIHSFIRKRICWIKKDEFKSRIQSTNGDAKAELESFKIWLFTKWLRHIVTSIRELEGINCIHFFFNEKKSEESFYIPGTLPGCFHAKQPDRSPKPDIELTFDCQFKEADQKIDEIENKLIFYYTRHRDLFKFNASYNSWHCFQKTISANVYYSENLSGTLSYFNQLYSSRENIKETEAKLLFLKLAEQALLRIGIADERFQYWWGQLPVGRAGSLHQSRINPLYLQDQNDQNYQKDQVKYGQKDFPSHGFFSKIKKKKKEERQKDKAFEFYMYPENDEKAASISKLWPEGQRGFDMIMIHQGILDKWKENNKTKEALAREILDLKEVIPFIIITSGRGKPENLPEGIKYLGFSGIEACMVGTYFEKLSLMRQVMVLI